MPARRGEEVAARGSVCLARRSADDAAANDAAQLHSRAELIQAGKAALGIEFGSTRIKAALVAPDGSALASGPHGWESHLRDGVWTHGLDEVSSGLAACYPALAEEVRSRYQVTPRRCAVGATPRVLACGE